MPYFENREPEQETYDPLFREPVEDAPYDEEEYDLEEYDLDSFGEEDADTDWRDIRDPDEREERLRRRDQLKLIFGVSDFVLVILGTVAVLALVALLIVLAVWVRDDILQRFPVLQNLAAAVPDTPRMG